MKYPELKLLAEKIDPHILKCKIHISPYFLGQSGL